MTSPAWILASQSSIDSLQFIDDHPTPSVGEYDVLVKLHAASLNYRDIVLAKVRHLKQYTMHKLT